MIVGLDSQSGTIGGGRLEHLALRQARAILDHPPGSWRIQDYPLGPMLGQCCGGRVRLLVEHLEAGAADWLAVITEGDVLTTKLLDRRLDRAIGGTPAPAGARGPLPDMIVERLGEYRLPLYLFGAGHVGQAIARVLAPLPIDLAWFDARAEFGEIDAVTYVPPKQLPGCAAGAPADAAILVLTHDHALDFDVTAAALKSQASFVGLIGSSTKRARFRSRLTAAGIDIARLTCPIGIPGIDGKEPDVIAISVTAQLLLLRKTAVADSLPETMRKTG
jgi:xanthine dehydrogenase accessory factor